MTPSPPCGVPFQAGVQLDTEDRGSRMTPSPPAGVSMSEAIIQLDAENSGSLDSKNLWGTVGDLLVFSFLF